MYSYPDIFQQQLAWVIDAPALIPAVPYIDAGDLLAELYRPPILCDNAAALPTDLPQHPAGRLGAHFENLVAALLNASDRFSILARNWVIRDGNKTLGELDMVVEDHGRQALQHWELAIKFYLAYGDDWLGPNSKDTLSKKSSHLLEQQLPRSLEPEVYEQLLQAGWPVAERVLLTRGRLFYPLSEGPLPSSPTLTTDHQRGWWVSTPDLPSTACWYLVPRPLWPTPELSDMRGPGIASALLVDYVDRLNRPVMAISGPQQAPGFIVPKGWPYHDRTV